VNGIDSISVMAIVVNLTAGLPLISSSVRLDNVQLFIPSVHDGWRSGKRIKRTSLEFDVRVCDVTVNDVARGTA
jgi:hypothetical protein